MGKIFAPFSPDQVRRLNAYQESGAFHPFTCENHRGPNRALVARVQGWYCRGCDYTQAWAHDFMADPRWERRVAKTED